MFRLMLPQLLLLIALFSGCSDRTQQSAVEKLLRLGAEVRVDAKGDAYWMSFPKKEIPVETWEFLKKTPHLRTLNLAGTPITDSDLHRLEFLNDLETLDLSYTQITPLGLAVLHQFKRLSTLSLNGIELKPDALEPLRQLHLKGLGLADSKADPKLIQQLQSALGPTCIIIR